MARVSWPTSRSTRSHDNLRLRPEDADLSLHVVTGAFGYIGRHIARKLLERGEGVRTVTTHPRKPNPFGAAVEAFPYDFDNPEALTDHLRGARTLFNTYWIRFEYGNATFHAAVENTRTLFRCARRAGVEKIVHIGVTNARLADPLAYYDGKARQDQLLREAGVPYAIVRPTLVFGPGDILVNNIAWLIRRFPLFPIFGRGDYRLQPVHVGDLAEISIQAAAAAESIELDAVGPESFTFEAFVERMAQRLDPGLRIIHLPPRFGIALGSAIGWVVGDVLLTWDELQGLMREKLTSDQAPNGETRFSRWFDEHYPQLGREYASEIARHYRWRART